MSFNIESIEASVAEARSRERRERSSSSRALILQSASGRRSWTYQNLRIELIRNSSCPMLSFLQPRYVPSAMAISQRMPKRREYNT